MARYEFREYRIQAGLGVRNAGHEPALTLDGAGKASGLVPKNLLLARQIYPAGSIERMDNADGEVPALIDRGMRISRDLACSESPAGRR